MPTQPYQPNSIGSFGKFLALSFLIAITLPADAQESAKTEAVLQLFEKRCQECHHPDTDDEPPYLHAGVTVAELISDEAIVPGDLEKSIVYERANLPAAHRSRMPRSRGKEGEDESYRAPLANAEKTLIEQWILELGGIGLTESEPSTPSAETVAAASVADDAVDTSAPLIQQVGRIFDRHCHECHSEQGSRKKYTLGSTSDFAELIASGKAKEIFDRVSLPAADSDRMPLSEGEEEDANFRPALTAEEIEIIGRWVAGEGDNSPAVTRDLIELTDTLDTIYRDVREQGTNAQSYRYFTLSNLYNAQRPDGTAEFSDAVLDTYRIGLSKLINHLSFGGRVVPPTAVDEEKTVYRIDLRDYAWDKDEWERIAGFYPHGIRGVSQQKERIIEEATGSDMAYLRADWFAFAAAQPPLYDEIMAYLFSIEDTSAEGAQQRMEDALGVDRVGNLKKGDAIRAGFLRSGVSKANRLIERHETKHGAYWISYDFGKKPGNPADGDLTRAPLGPVEAKLTDNEDHIFIHDGGEMIYTLPNGYQGYFLATADGKRLDTAPLNIVQHEDKTKRLLENESIINGVSCMECHRRGMKGAVKVDLGLPDGVAWNEEKLGPNPQTVAGMKDEIGPATSNSPLFDFKEKGVIAELYKTENELRRTILLDQEKFLEADEAASMGLSGDGAEPISALYEVYHENSIDALRLASELGMDKDELLEFLDKEKFESDDAFRLHEDLAEGRAITRDVFMQVWPALVPVLGFELAPFEPLGYAEFGGEIAAETVRESPAFIVLFGADGKAPKKSKQEAKKAIAGASGKVRSSREILLPGGKKLKVSVNAELKAGEKGVLEIESERDIYVNIIQYGADNSITQFVPSKTVENNFVAAGKKRRIGVLTSPNVGIKVGKGGAETFEVTASVEPMRLAAAGKEVDGATVYEHEELFSPRGVATAFELVDEPGSTGGTNRADKKKSPEFLGQARVTYLLIED